jgi:hypothetical protein
MITPRQSNILRVLAGTMAAITLAYGAPAFAADPPAPAPPVKAQPAPPKAQPTAAPHTKPPSTSLRIAGLRIVKHASGSVLITGVLEASLDYPRVQVQLLQDNTPLTGENAGTVNMGAIQDINDLNRILDGKHKQERDDKFTAFFDTGASASVISKATARRFGIQAVEGGVYHEVGLHGATAMNVSKPYTLLIRGITGLTEPNGDFRTVAKAAVLQLSQADGNPLVEMVMGEVNVIGMPAIRQYVACINTGGVSTISNDELANLDLGDLQKPDVLARLERADASPGVTLYDPGHKIGPVDIILPLKYTSFSRRKNPLDKGPLPDLADNPVLVGVKTQQGAATFTGDWLLDTGAPVNMVSTKQAQALGLFNKEGKPTREPEYSLPMGGIGGKVDNVPGFKIQSLVIPAADNKTLEYLNPVVFVADISTTLDDGTQITLDGIVGTSLFYPTAGGISTGFPTDTAPSAFESIWIDGPGARLLLKLQSEPVKK